MIPPFASTTSLTSDAPTRLGSLCLANARLVLCDHTLHGALTIENGIITDITEGDAVPTGSLDCQGDTVIPGLVELHTDNLERHIEPRPKVDWPHLPAILAHDAELASTGITTVFDTLRLGTVRGGKARYVPYARPLADTLLRARATGHLKISHFLHLRAELCSDNLLDEMAAFAPDDHIGIVSLMDHTPGQRQFSDLEKLKVYWGKKRSLSDADFDEHVANLRRLQAHNGAKHEAGAVVEANRYGAILASHDDTTVAHVATSKTNGCRFAEFPTSHEAAQACRDHDIAIMLGAPNIVRGESHSGNVSALDLAKDNLLDIVSSDYVPAALLASAFRLARMWQDLPRAVACVTQNPAQAVGLMDRGRLGVGLRGDVLRVGLMQDHVPFLRGVWRHGVQIS